MLTKLDHFLSQYVTVKSTDIELKMDLNQGKKFHKLSKLFIEQSNEALKFNGSYPDNYNYIKEIYPLGDAHLRKCACYTGQRLKGVVESILFDRPCFMTMGSLSHTDKDTNGVKQAGHMTKSPSAITFTGLNGQEIETSHPLVPRSHQITIYLADIGKWRAILDLKPETLSGKRTKPRSASIDWFDLQSNSLSRDFFINSPLRFFTYELELLSEDGEVCYYIGSSSILSELSRTMTYGGSGTYLALAMKQCGLKVVKKTITKWLETEKLALQEERRQLSYYKNIGHTKKIFLNAPNGMNSNELFSIKRFLDSSTLIHENNE